MTLKKSIPGPSQAVDFSLFQATPGMFFIVLPDDPTFTIIAATNDACNYFGIHQEAILQKSLFEIYSRFGFNGNKFLPDLHRSLQQLITTNLSQQVPMQQTAVQAGDGILKQVYWKSGNHPYLNDKGELVYIFHSMEDLTAAQHGDGSSAAGYDKTYHFFKSAPVIIGLLKGDDYIIEMANEGLLEVWGRNEEVIGKPLLKAIPELEPQGFIGLFESVRTSGESFYAYEFPIVLNRNGKDEVIYFDFVYKPLYEVEGEKKASGIISVGHNVTAQVQAKKKVEESEKKYRGLFESMDQGFCIFEVVFNESRQPVDLRYMETNPMFEMQTGLTDVIGKTVRDVAPGLESRWFERYYDVALSGKSLRFIEVSEYLGSWYDVYAFKLGDSTSSSVAILFTDITERKKAEQKLRESEDRFRNLADDSPIFVFIIDPDPDAPVNYWNKTWLEYTGQTLNEAVGRAWNAFIHPDDIVVVMEHYVPAFQNRQSYLIPSVRVKRYDGEYRWFAFKGNPRYMPNGDFNGFVGVGFDIHEQKLAEVALQKSEAELQAKVAERTADLEKTVEALKRSNTNLEEFAYAASHDLKEPIRKIHFFSDSLKTTLSKHLRESELRDFQRMEAASKRMSSLIDDLLAYSQVSFTAPSYQTVDLNQVIQMVLQDLDLEIEQKKAAVTVGNLPILQGHQRQLQQAFQNLISNALKYTTPGTDPQIAIDCKTVDGSGVKANLSSEDRLKRYYVLTIKDNGIGFRQSDAERIFNVFTRLHGNNIFRGTGIGLSIVRKVMENHKGFVTAESEPGQGASFFLYFPVNSEIADS